jgi:RNA polymerase sigma-70 factor (ECF subfamily)
LTVEGPASAEDPSPLAPLFAAISAELHRFVLGVTRDPDLADDVMQATFLKALEHGHEARSETARGWLFRVAFHEALAQRRRASSREAGRRKFADLVPKEHNPAEDPLIRAETVARVREALGSLPRDQRDVVLARVYGEKTFAEIARENGLPLGTVLTRMRRALEKMKQVLNPGG